MCGIDQSAAKQCQRFKQAPATFGIPLCHVKQLAPTTQHTDRQADSGSNADGGSGIFVDISIGSGCSLAGFDTEIQRVCLQSGN